MSCKCEIQTVLTFDLLLCFRRLAVDVNPSDSSYMPHRVVVQGGPTPENVIDLNTVSYLSPPPLSPLHHLVICHLCNWLHYSLFSPLLLFPLSGDRSQHI